MLPNLQIGFKSTPSPEEIIRTSTSDLHEVELKNCEANSVFEKIRLETKLTEEDILGTIHIFTFLGFLVFEIEARSFYDGVFPHK